MNENAGMNEDFCYYIFELFLPRGGDSEMLLPKGNFFRSSNDNSPSTSASLPSPVTHVPTAAPVSTVVTHSAETHPADRSAGASSGASTDGSSSGHHGISTGSIILLL